MTVVGLISPGDMGASIGAAVTNPDTDVIWAGNARSEATHKRADTAGLRDCGTVAAMVESADIILSICPPHDAEAVATEISSSGFQGLFADCNAIAPQKSCQLSSLFPEGRFVDGGIVGGPAWKAESGTMLYLSGAAASTVDELFPGSPLGTQVIGDDVGSASAMKMAFAAYTKGSTALLAAILGVAESHGVREVLEGQWGETFTDQTHKRLVNNSTKAWRFSGEMLEIARTFEEAGYPDGFHQSAAEIFDRLSEFKDAKAEDIQVMLQAMARSS